MRKMISGMLVVAALLALSSTAASGAVPVLRVQPGAEVTGGEATGQVPVRTPSTADARA